jgi:hypothetical protein
MARPESSGESWNLELEGLPRSEEAMQRIDAWYQCQIIDRVPVRFMAHNAFLDTGVETSTLTPEERRARWFDVEYQVDLFERSIEGRTFHGETFPVYWPNLGPNVYAAFYGLELEFGEVTSWSEPMVRDWDAVDSLKLDMDSIHFRKIEALTQHALERCQGRYLVGYTDLHPGIDCVAAWRGMDRLCMDMVDSPERVKELAKRGIADFEMVYDHFDAMLRAHGQPSSRLGDPEPPQVRRPHLSRRRQRKDLPADGRERRPDAHPGLLPGGRRGRLCRHFGQPPGLFLLAQPG